MAAFITRTLDQTLKRGSDRAALDQFWTTQTSGGLGLTALGSGISAFGVISDGLDLWVAAPESAGLGNKVFRIRASTGNPELMAVEIGRQNAN